MEWTTSKFIREIVSLVREIDSLDKFTIALKDHLWLILGFEPD